MKFALAQMEVKAGRPKENLETMLNMIDDAKEQSVDLIAFPEMAVGGYLVGDRWTSDSFCKNLMEFNDRLLEASKGIAIAYGNIFRDDEIKKRTGSDSFHPNKDGRSRKYNAIYVMQDCKMAKRAKEIGILPKGVQPKALLPTYRFFDDQRYFFSLEDVAKDFSTTMNDLIQPYMIEVDGKEVPVGFEMCEDLWCADYRMDRECINPTKALIENGAEYIVNLSASPWTYGKNDARDRRVEFIKDDIKNDVKDDIKDDVKDYVDGDFVPFMYVNKTGVQNNGKNIITFDGGSTAYNKDGKPVAYAKGAYLEELLIISNETFEAEIRPRPKSEKIAEKYDAIIKGISHVKDMMGRSGHPKYVIGLSGGVDSALVASLLVDAVGKENVIGVNMPTRYNSDETKGAAAHLVETLGIKYITVPIQDMVDNNISILESALDLEVDGVTDENLQAKIRGTAILSNIASMVGGVFTNNGNKVEIATGYATLYGDVGGAIVPIGDLTKVEVFEMARYINEQKGFEIIPEDLLPDKLYNFKIDPSAELKEKQVDPFKWGYHDALIEVMTDYKKASPEDIMGWYQEGILEDNLGISNDLIKRWGIDDPNEFVRDLEWFTAMIDRAVFKRVQAPPIIITSKTAYGFDNREAIIAYEPTLKYDRMKENMLMMERYEVEQ